MFIVILRNSLQGIGDQRTPVFSSFIELAGKVVFTLVFVRRFGYWAVIWTRTGHMDLHGDPTDRDGSRKPGIIWKTKIGAFYGALDMVSGNGSLLWSAVSMVFKSGEKAGL